MSLESFATRPRIQKLLDGKEDLLYKFGMVLRPAPAGKPLPLRGGLRISSYIRFITWYLKRFPDLIPTIIQNSTRGSLGGSRRNADVEIRTDPKTGARVLHEDGDYLMNYNCPKHDHEKDRPVVLAGFPHDLDTGEQFGEDRPAQVIYA